MNPFASLSDENQDQIRKYLKFFRQKKDGILRSIQREINDLESERLNEEVFTREDVLDLVEFFSSAVKVSSSHGCSSSALLTVLLKVSNRRRCGIYREYGGPSS